MLPHRQFCLAKLEEWEVEEIKVKYFKKKNKEGLQIYKQLKPKVYTRWLMVDTLPNREQDCLLWNCCLSFKFCEIQKKCLTKNSSISNIASPLIHSEVTSQSLTLNWVSRTLTFTEVPWPLFSTKVLLTMFTCSSLEHLCMPRFTMAAAVGFSRTLKHQCLLVLFTPKMSSVGHN